MFVFDPATVLVLAVRQILAKKMHFQAVRVPQDSQRENILQWKKMLKI